MYRVSLFKILLLVGKFPALKNQDTLEFVTHVNVPLSPSFIVSEIGFIRLGSIDLI